MPYLLYLVCFYTTFLLSNNSIVQFRGFLKNHEDMTRVTFLNTVEDALICGVCLSGTWLNVLFPAPPSPQSIYVGKPLPYTVFYEPNNETRKPAQIHLVNLSLATEKSMFLQTISCIAFQTPRALHMQLHSSDKLFN